MYWISVKKRDSIKNAISYITGVSNANFFNVDRSKKHLDGVTAFVAVLYEVGVSIDMLRFDAKRSKASVYRLLKRHERLYGVDGRYTKLYNHAMREAKG